MNGFSSSQTDYTYFGSELNDSLYRLRRQDLSDVKRQHTSDSVGRSLSGSTPRSVLTCSMLDYRDRLARPPRGRVRLGAGGLRPAAAVCTDSVGKR